MSLFQDGCNTENNTLGIPNISTTPLRASLNIPNYEKWEWGTKDSNEAILGEFIQKYNVEAVKGL